VSIFKKNATVNSQESKKTKFVLSAKEIEDQQLHNSITNFLTIIASFVYLFVKYNLVGDRIVIFFLKSI
jgi:hypothetical protein